MPSVVVNVQIMNHSSVYTST